MKRQLGLSLIELMIGLILASLIIAGVLYVFTGARASSLLIETESRMQDDAQFAMDKLNSVIRMAGFASDPLEGASDLQIVPPTINGDVIQGVEGGTDPDEITVWFEGSEDGQVFDCHGHSVDEDVLVSNHYYLDEGRLVCDRRKSDTGTPFSSTPQPLIDNVADLQIQFGIDTDDPVDGIVNRYLNFDEITTDDMRLSIISVSLALTLEGNVTGETLQKTFASTIHLRNRAP